ncbi:MAG: Phosphoadenosine phosphosulfate reductase [Myxococcota bacterium]|nr:Phosphoadenosine phosphosulfate reductase [Myxococcota bacterium]
MITYGVEEIDALSQSLEKAAPLEILKWAYERLERVEIGTSLGPSGIVIIHMAKQITPSPKVFTLDTDFLFPETLKLKERVETEMGVPVTSVKPALTPGQQEEQYGARLWERDPDQCCQLRKVAPLEAHIQNMDGWINGVRRDQGPSRQNTPILELTVTPSGHSLIKLNPLANWNRKQVWKYILDNNLPYNTLHDQGYKSIGCTHCTRPVDENANERDGRWSGQGKVECGIHTFTAPARNRPDPLG